MENNTIWTIIPAFLVGMLAGLALGLLLSPKWLGTEKEIIKDEGKFYKVIEVKRKVTFE